MDPDIFAPKDRLPGTTQVRDAGLEYVFNRDGLIVEPMFPDVIAACVKQLVITHSKLKPFAESEQLHRPLDRRSDHRCIVGLRAARTNAEHICRSRRKQTS